MMIAAVEAGGTSFSVSVVRRGRCGDFDVADHVSIPTTTPADTVGAVVAWLAARGPFAAAGVASFGPVDLNEGSDTYGFITNTPKPGWANVDIVGPLKRALECPVGFDTDVNAPALNLAKENEYRSCAYVTLGTGVGVGLYVDGSCVHGILHPEMGHITVPRHPDDVFEGKCPFHASCVEGMVGTPALAARFGCSAADLPEQADDAAAWTHVAHQIAHLCVNIVLSVAPQRISIGGGVARRKILLPLIREQFAKQLNGYIKLPVDVGEYISLAPPNAGLQGAYRLGLDAADKAA